MRDILGDIGWQAASLGHPLVDISNMITFRGPKLALQIIGTISVIKVLLNYSPILKWIPNLPLIAALLILKVSPRLEPIS